MTYTWECFTGETSTTPCQFRNTTTVPSFTTPDLSLPGSLFSIAATMAWKLTVSKGENRSASTYAKVAITSASGPALYLLGPKDRVEPHEVVMVQAITTSLSLANYTFVWSVDGCDSKGCAQGSTTGDFIKIVMSKVTVAADGTCKVGVTARDIESGKSGTAELYIAVDTPPNAGDFVVDPSEGDGWVTNFTLSATGFTAGGSKIFYEFLYKKPGKDTFIPISMKGESNSIVVPLPPGPPEEDYKIELAVKAYNMRGAFVMVNTTIRCLESVDQNMSVVGKYNAMKTASDQNNPADILKQILVGTLLLSDQVDVVQPPQTGEVQCNEHGTWVNGRCICNPGYGKRADCSVSDSQFVQEGYLAQQLLSDAVTFVKANPTAGQSPAAAQIAINVATKPDLLDDPTRKQARDLLESSIAAAVPMNNTELVKAIDGIAVLSKTGDQQGEFTQVRNILNTYLNFSVRNIETVFGNETVVTEANNFKAQAALIRGSYNFSMNMSNIQFPPTNVLLGNTDDYVTLSVIEWNTPLYSWSSDYVRVTSGIVTIEAKDQKGNLKNITGLSEAINITFPLDIKMISARDLTALRCTFYDPSTGVFAATGMKFITLDLDAGIGSCQATHLTDFAMSVLGGLSNVIVDPQHNDPAIFGVTIKVYDIHKSPLFWFTVSLTIVFIYFWLWAYCKEKSENELVSLMKSKTYMEQKDFFQLNKSGLENMPSQSNVPVELQPVGASASQSASQNSPRASQEDKQGESPMGKQVTKIELMSHDKAEGAGKMKTSVIGVPEEAKKDNFDAIAEPIDPAISEEAEGKAQKKFRRKKKFKKTEQKGETPAGASESIHPPQNIPEGSPAHDSSSNNVSSDLQLNQPGSQPNNALALILGKTAATESSPTERGFCLLFLV